MQLQSCSYWEIQQMTKVIKTALHWKNYLYLHSFKIVNWGLERDLVHENKVFFFGSSGIDPTAFQTEEHQFRL